MGEEIDWWWANTVKMNVRDCDQVLPEKPWSGKRVSLYLAIYTSKAVSIHSEVVISWLQFETEFGTNLNSQFMYYKDEHYETKTKQYSSTILYECAMKPICFSTSSGIKHPADFTGATLSQNKTLPEVRQRSLELQELAVRDKPEARFGMNGANDSLYALQAMFGRSISSKCLKTNRMMDHVRIV